MRYPFPTGVHPALLREVGLQGLDPVQGTAALRTFAAELERRVVIRLRNAMSASQRAELDRLLSRGAIKDVRAFYDRALPGHPRVAAEELERFTAELRANVAIERAFEGVSPIYHDAMVRLDARLAQEVEGDPPGPVDRT